MINAVLTGFGDIGSIVTRLLKDYPGIKIVAGNDWRKEPRQIVDIVNRGPVHNIRGEPVFPLDESVIALDDVGLKLGYQEEPFPVFRVGKPNDLVAKLSERGIAADMVIDCSGHYKADLGGNPFDYIGKQGIRGVVISGPVSGYKVVAHIDTTKPASYNDTIAYFINPINYTCATSQLILPYAVNSCGSCTTNCMTQIVKIGLQINGLIGAEGITVHARTNQYPRDNYLDNLLPKTSGAGKLTKLFFPEIEYDIPVDAIYVDVPIGSVMRFTLHFNREINPEEFLAAAESCTSGEMGRTVYIDRTPLQDSIVKDVWGTKHSARIISGSIRHGATKRDIVGMAYYDNLNGISNRIAEFVGDKAIYLERTRTQ